MMIVFGSRAHGESRRRAVQALGVTFHKGEWMESGEDPLLSPTISLIEQPANYKLESHFHRQNQFQLFIGGGGTIGSSTLQPITVHYAGAYTGYGPLVAGPDGIQYFTIRPVCESGALSITEARDQMVRGPKRHATSAPIKLATAAELERLSASESVDVIAVGEDGMGARVVRLPSRAQLHTEFPAAADGTFVIVLAGTLSHADGILSQWESVYVSSPAELPALTAGPGGAECIILFVPPKAPAYR
jgi:hypothetical protein